MSGLAQTIIIAEPNPDGHRLYYVALLVDECLSRGHKVVFLTSTAAIDSAEFQLHLGAYVEKIAVETMGPLTLNSLTSASGRYNATVTVIPDGDRTALAVAQTTGWRGHGTLSILVMREPRPVTIRGFKIKALVKSLLIKRASRMRRVRVLILKSAVWSGRSAVEVARDPVTLVGNESDIDNFRMTNDLSGATYWYSVLGAINGRKNLPLVVEAFEMLDRQDVGLLVAGKCDPEVIAACEPAFERIQASEKRLVILDKMLTDLELDSAVVASDCLVLAHSNEGPSGLMGKAAAAGTRMITAGASSLRTDSANLPGLAVWVSLSAVDINSAMAVANRLPRPKPIAGLGREEFASALLGIGANPFGTYE